MVSTDHEGLDQIINDLTPEHIPAELVAGARITSDDGAIYNVSTEELSDIVSDSDSLEEQGIAHIRLIVDLVQVREVIIHYSDKMLRSIIF